LDKNHLNAECFRYLNSKENNVFICAVHDDVYTKMVGFKVNEMGFLTKRLDGRAVEAFIHLDA